MRWRAAALGGAIFTSALSARADDDVERPPLPEPIFAESATYVRQRRIAPDGDPRRTILQFEVGTGELGDAARFGPHGHVVVINVAGAIGAFVAP